MTSRSKQLHPAISLAIRITIGLLILGGAFGLFGVLSSMRVDTKHRTPADTAFTVGVIEATPVSIAQTWDGYGTARALRLVELSSEVAARVVRRPAHIDPGVYVEAGELIVELDAADFEQRVLVESERLTSLQANLKQFDIERTRLLEQIELAVQERDIAKREYDRATSALARGGSTESELETRLSRWIQASRTLSTLQESLDNWPLRKSAIEADVRRAQADLRLAQTNVARTTLTAPIAGFVQDVFLQEGEWATVSAPVARIVNLSTIEVPVRLPMDAGGKIEVGSDVTLRADSRSGSAWQGTITRMAPEADSATRSFTVFVEVSQNVSRDPQRGVRSADGQSLLLPGQFLLTRVSGSAKSPHLIVPREAIDGGRVMLVRETEDGSRAESAEVEVLYYIDGAFESIHPTARQWAVLAAEAIPEGTQVIVTNLDDVRPRQRVKGAVISSEEPSE